MFTKILTLSHNVLYNFILQGFYKIWLVKEFPVLNNKFIAWIKFKALADKKC